MALGGLVAVGGLAACGDDGEGDGTGGSGDGGSSTEATESALVLQLMADSASSLVVGEPARLPVGISDFDGALVEDGPSTLTVAIEDQDGNVLESGLEVAKRDTGLTRAYYPVAFTTPAVGFYRITSEVDGQPLDAAFEVRDPASVAIPRPGQPLPPTPTPTVADARGVDPICTQDPPCALHEVDLEAALGTTPLAVLVSTPAFCQTAICGPVLDLFAAAAGDTPDVGFVHVEVYESAEEVEELGPEATLAPAVDAWQLPYEPCLFLVAADGTVAERLDVIYDAGELSEALARLTA